MTSRWPAFAGLLLLTLTGWTCRLPQRLFTFLPPTNLLQLCQSDKRFFYSTEFDFCFQYGSDAWSKVEVSPLKALAGTNISEYDFFLPYKNEPQLLFTLYVTTTSASAEASFKKQGIPTTHIREPYLFGVIKSEDIPAELQPASNQIDTMIRAIQVFAKTEPVQ